MGSYTENALSICALKRSLTLISFLLTYAEAPYAMLNPRLCLLVVDSEGIPSKVFYFLWIDDHFCVFPDDRNMLQRKYTL